MRNYVVSPTLRATYRLVMHGYIDVLLFFEILIAVILTLISSGFVTQRPHYDGYAVPVAIIHPLNSVFIMLLPSKVVTYHIRSIKPQIVQSAVSLDVRFVNYIQTVIVSRLNK